MSQAIGNQGSPGKGGFSYEVGTRSVDLIMDKFSGRPRGFGFVTMETKEGADAAIQALNGKSVDGRAMTVNEARPREERPRGGGGGGG